MFRLVPGGHFAGAEDKLSQASCGAFGYELLTTRLDSLENA
ncbi:hypothetical protein quinque_016470, partial [Culex quinquefasciatus]